MPRANNISTRYKITEKWDSLFRIIKHYKDANYYDLQEPGHPPLLKSIHGDQLKKFIQDEDGWWYSEKDLEPEPEESAIKKADEVATAVPEKQEASDQLTRRVTRSMAAVEPVADPENDTDDSKNEEEDLGELNPMPNPPRRLKLHYEVRLKGLTKEEKATYELID
jgi:hypothetical protein